MLIETNDWEKIEADADCVVAFTATWCGPCQQLKPQFAKASVRDGSRNYYVVDIDALHPDVLESYSIKSVPQVFKTSFGLIEKRVSGRTASDIVSEINS